MDLQTRTLTVSSATFEMVSPMDGMPNLIVLPEIFGGIRGYTALIRAFSGQGFKPAGLNLRLRS